jgi:hypothetical protein
MRKKDENYEVSPREFFSSLLLPSCLLEPNNLGNLFTDISYKASCLR